MACASQWVVVEQVRRIYDWMVSSSRLVVYPNVEATHDEAKVLAMGGGLNCMHIGVEWPQR